VKLVDGTTITMPDTADNQWLYPQPRTQQPGLGFPVARVVALLCLGTGTDVDSALAPQAGKEGSEHAPFHTLLPNIAEGDMLLADRYYCTYVTIAAASAWCRCRVPGTRAAAHRLP
jgi:hypothetical protein